MAVAIDNWTAPLGSQLLFKLDTQASFLLKGRLHMCSKTVLSVTVIVEPQKVPVAVLYRRLQVSDSYDQVTECARVSVKPSGSVCTHDTSSICERSPNES